MATLRLSRAASILGLSSSVQRALHRHSFARLEQRGFSFYTKHSIVKPRVFPNDGFTRLDSNERFEEERLPCYTADSYYPVRLGEVFRSRYQVVAKLGFGTTSTVWLCRDLQNNVLRTLKVCVLNQRETQEVAISHHIKSMKSNHLGKRHLRIALEDFQMKGPKGHHQCLVFPALGVSLEDVRELFDEKALPKAMLQPFLIIIITGLDFMHKAGVVHTDISPDNILLGADDTALNKVEQAEIDQPSPRKVLEDRTIHLSYTMPTTYKAPVITDFGAARLSLPVEKHSGDVMPAQFRAPEIIAGTEWDSKIDIWSIGVMVWNLLEAGNLFRPYKDGHLDDELHFAQMVSFMGPPPKEFLERSDCSKFWDAEGNWIGATPIPEQTLETRLTRLHGKDKDLLLAFLRKILTWLPEDRASAQDLFKDEFVTQFMSEDDSEDDSTDE